MLRTGAGLMARSGARQRLMSSQASTHSEYRLRSSIERGRQQYMRRNAATAAGLTGLCAAVYFYSLYAVKQEDFTDVPMPAMPTDKQKEAYSQGGSK